MLVVTVVVVKYTQMVVNLTTQYITHTRFWYNYILKLEEGKKVVTLFQLQKLMGLFLRKKKVVEVIVEGQAIIADQPLTNNLTLVVLDKRC
jgi:hypothetical protein